MNPQIPPPKIDWTVPPDPEEIENLRSFAALSMWDKLQWLEEAQRMVEHMNGQRPQQESKERLKV